MNPQSFRKSFTAGILFPLLMLLFLKLAVFPCHAEEIPYQNSETGYSVIIDDRAGLLTAEETRQLSEDMKSLTDYGSIAFVTVAENNTSAGSFAEKYCHSHFGTDSAAVFLIDMDNRMVYIFSDGAMEKPIGQSGAETITDNIYRYATNEEYYTCASLAFEQIERLEEGLRIAQSMKYIGNGLTAVLLSMLIMFVVITGIGSLRFTERQLMAGTSVRIADSILPVIRHTGTSTRIIEHSSDSSSSSDSGGGGSSGGGGGGSSGSGGGHSF